MALDDVRVSSAHDSLRSQAEVSLALILRFFAMALAISLTSVMLTLSDCCTVVVEAILVSVLVQAVNVTTLVDVTTSCHGDGSRLQVSVTTVDNVVVNIDMIGGQSIVGDDESDGVGDISHVADGVLVLL
jgi:hypothetical protein